jgi:hypothetical protein
VFPNPDHGPSSAGEPAVGVNVANAVGVNFGVPVRMVRSREAEVNRTTVPETTIEEDHHASPREEQICCPT